MIEKIISEFKIFQFKYFVKFKKYIFQFEKLVKFKSTKTT